LKQCIGHFQYLMHIKGKHDQNIPNKLENAMFSVIRNYHLFGHLIHAQY